MQILFQEFAVLNLHDFFLHVDDLPKSDFICFSLNEHCRVFRLFRNLGLDETKIAGITKEIA